MRYIASAFSLSMLGGEEGVIRVSKFTVEDAVEWLQKGKAVSAIGHEGTAQIVSEILGVEVPANRVMIKLDHGDEVLVFQLLQRQPEGKVLSKAELEAIVNSGKWGFFLVERIG